MPLQSETITYITEITDLGFVLRDEAVQSDPDFEFLCGASAYSALASVHCSVLSTILKVPYTLGL